jgi:hypothetical protein
MPLTTRLLTIGGRQTAEHTIISAQSVGYVLATFAYSIQSLLVTFGHLVSDPCTGRFSPFFLASHKANTLPTWHQSEFFYLQSYTVNYINSLSSEE